MAKQNKNAFNSLSDSLSANQLKQIEQLISESAADPEIELEVGFRGLDYVLFTKLSEYLIKNTDDNNISQSISLDIIYQLPNDNTFRISLSNEEQINLVVEKYSHNGLTSYLTSLKPNDDVRMEYKDRGASNRVFVEEFNLIFKATRETPITKTTDIPDLTNIDKILYRYKTRYSFQIDKSYRVDLTEVQESRRLANLANLETKYEMELEVTGKIKTDSLFNQISNLISVLQDSPVPISKPESEAIIRHYQALLGLKTPHLVSRNVISIEPVHIVNFIPNRYAVTDKADGERYFLIVVNSEVYLISTNMVVKRIGLRISNEKFNNIILDGEYVPLESSSKLFLAFDVVYADGIDYRHDDKYNLVNRLEVLVDIIDKCFNNLIPFTDYTDKSKDMEIGKIRNFYTKEIKSYWTEFNNRLKRSEEAMFITRKICFVPYGIDSSEVFMYADLLWKLEVYSNLTPYKLDGIIYTPINAPYSIRTETENLDSVPLEYKWKPPSQNSIDFYIEFEKNVRGEDAIYYDEAVVEENAASYKICKLFVGIYRGNTEKPIPFKVNGVEQRANIYLSDGEAIDLEGNVIIDRTVVEFIFDNTKPEIDNAYKWSPIRTRLDKTESVRKYGRKYGNNLQIATRIWRTIINPVTEENIATLANPATYEKEYVRLEKSIGSKKPESQGTAYYQKVTGNAAGMRAFNNWIKSNMITTYCHKKNSVLDIGCGRGGDLYKFVSAEIGSYVGLDIDYNSLYVINDSAFNRYKKIKNAPPMTFIQADAKAKFDVESQLNVLPRMNNRNKELITQYLNSDKTYDVVNAQFTIHYYLSDPVSWSNFCKNLAKTMDNGSHLLITTFDGKLVYDQLKDRQKMTVSYTDNKGNKVNFFEIKKFYDDNETSPVGMAIDLYNSLINNPGVYIREYLVFPDFLIQSLRERCGLELVESDSFYNMFHLYKRYFSDERSSNLAEVSDRRFEDIRKFYQTLHPNNHSDVNADVARASFKFAMLNRYYVFKKTKQIDLEPSRIVHLNHKVNLGYVIEPYLEQNQIRIDPQQKTSDIMKIYRGICKRYDVKPSVYLIKNRVVNEKLDHLSTDRNVVSLDKIKDGDSDKLALIYKSPEKHFYPIYYQKPKLITDTVEDRNKRSYILESKKIVSDLELLVAISNRFLNSD